MWVFRWFSSALCSSIPVSSIGQFSSYQAVPDKTLFNRLLVECLIIQLEIIKSDTYQIEHLLCLSHKHSQEYIMSLADRPDTSQKCAIMDNDTRTFDNCRTASYLRPPEPVPAPSVVNGKSCCNGILCFYVQIPFL